MTGEDDPSPATHPDLDPDRFVTHWFDGRGFPLAIAFHVEPFADGERLRAGWGCYESVFSAAAQSEPAVLRQNPDVQALILYGPSDHVIGPDFDRMAAVVFPDHVGPFLLRDCGHFVPWERPHALVSAIASFASDRLAARAPAPPSKP